MADRKPPTQPPQPPQAEHPAPRPIDRILRLSGGGAGGGGGRGGPVDPTDVAHGPGDEPNELGFLSGEGPALMIDFVLAGGERYGLPYSFLTAMYLDPPTALVLEFTTHHVQLTGRNLLTLYHHLLLHVVQRVAAATTPFDDQATTSWIATIRIEAVDRAA